MSIMRKKIRIGSRASKLAVVQSTLVMQQIQQIFPEAELELVTMKTTGDKILHKTLEQIGGKGLFLKELDAALLAGQVDICVHSLKDVPVQENPDLPVSAYIASTATQDTLVLPKGATEWDSQLPVGSASARRALQFQALHPSCQIQPIRGNVLTRLEKLDSGKYGALILAEAGLERLGLADRISYRFSPEEMVPAAGQGVLAVQSRAGEFQTLLEKLNDTDAAFCAKTERLLLQTLDGDCTAPIGAHVVLQGEQMQLYGFYAENGIAAKKTCCGNRKEAAKLVAEMAAQLQQAILERK